MLRKAEDPSKYFAYHSINVAIYSLVIGEQMQITLPDLKALSFATLMYNIGNLCISKDILYKPAGLTAEEWELIHTHPKRGAEILERLNAPDTAIVTALQHHERMDGGGYPSKLKGREIHLFARICTIADVFDALTNNRPFKAPIDPASAIKVMHQMEVKFDPNILKRSTGFDLK